jgi:sugar O-acyltransferase (sialic acid O-acetyltransferase NeuD family)
METNPINSEKKISIIGCGGHSRVVSEIVRLNGFNNIDYFNDDVSSSLHGISLLGNIQDLISQLSQYLTTVIAIGNNNIRMRLFEELSAHHASLNSFFHPQAIISQETSIASGTVIMAGAVINPNTLLGNACIINTLASIDHDCTISSGVHISPGAHLAGQVSIGHNSWVGIGSTIRENISVGNNVVIGAGSVVIKNIEDGDIVAGNPAVSIKHKVKK